MMNKQYIKDNISILDYCDYKGLEYRKDSHYRGQQAYKLIQHDSLVFVSDWFWWNSQSKTGDIIQFVMDIENVDFQEALEILKQIIPTGKKKLLQNAPQQNVVTYSKKYINNVIAYLNQKRKIDTNIIYQFLNNNNLTSDDNKNACFIVKDYQTDEVVGYEKHTTLSYFKWKGISKDIPYGVGFNVKIGTPMTIIVFESALDLISYYELKINTLTNVLLLSMAGLKLNIIQKAQNDLQANKIIFAIDNDEAGQKFISEALNALVSVSIELDIPTHHKDWNEALKAKKTPKI